MARPARSARPGARRFGRGRGEGDAVGGIEVHAEHAAERVEDAAGLGGGLQELAHLRGGEVVEELAAAAVDEAAAIDLVVIEGTLEPGAAAGDVEGQGLAGRRARPGGAGGAGPAPGKRAGFPAGDEFFETQGGLADAVVDEHEEGGPRLVAGGDGSDDATQSGDKDMED